MCSCCNMTHCTDLFFSPRNRALCVLTNWTGSSSTQRSSPSPSSFILGSGLLSSATLETLSKFTYMHTDIRTHSQMSTTHPSTDLFAPPAVYRLPRSLYSLFTGTLPGHCDGKIFRVAHRGGRERRMSKRRGDMEIRGIEG